MKVSDYVAAYLRAQNVSHVFEMVGGMTTHMVDSMYRLGSPRLMSVHHEQSASFAADAIGRITGVPGVAMATSGPGATNLLTGIASCYYDSSPAVFITGQVNRSEQKRGQAVRQMGFQETDIVSISKPITKAAWLIDEPGHVPAVLTEAFETALGGRPGPVLIDIPMDVQRADIPVVEPVPLPEPSRGEADPRLIEEAVTHLCRAKFPLLLAGGGVTASRGRAAFRAFAEKLGVPVVNSLMAVDALPGGHPLRVGMIGSYGNRWANAAVARSDVLLVLGSRLDVRQTGADTAAFSRGRTIYHVDCDPGQINNQVKGCIPVVCDLRAMLEAAVALAPRRVSPCAGWLAEIDRMKQGWPDTQELSGISGINPNAFMHQLAAVSRDASAYVVDVGQHQMWAAQSLDLAPGQLFVTSGGMGAMGFALPAALGAVLASPARPVVVIAGDGGFQVGIQELQTIAHHQLPIKMVVLNNECLGMVRQFQESYFESRYPGTCWGYSAPDFVRVSAAYGIPGCRVQTASELEAGLESMRQDPTRPFLLEVMIDKGANAYPKIAYGKPMTEMEPFVRLRPMERT